jgi:exopolysaccharide production protein ExoQ
MLKTLEKIYAVIALLFLSGGLIPTDLAQGEQDPTYIRAQIIGQVCVFSILAILCFIRWRPVMRGALAAGWPLALCGLAVLSAGWSLDPSFTLRRSVILLATTVFGVYLASCFEWDEQLNAFGWMVVLAVFGSYVIVALFPDYGISHDLHWGSWRGLFPHKNLLGLYMVFGILLMGFARPKSVPRWLRFATLIGAAGLLILSGSATAVAVAIVCLGAYPLIYMLDMKRRRTLPLWVPILPLFGFVAVFVYLNSSKVLELLGRDSTLTGRAQLWAVALSAIPDRLWFGHGYSAFWHMATFESTGALITATTHAHNGFLDLCLDLGLVGLSIFVISAIVFARRSLALLRSDELAAAKWPLIFLFLFVAYNVTESSMLRTHTFMWIPFISIYSALALMPSDATAEESESVMVAEYSA